MHTLTSVQTEFKPDQRASDSTQTSTYQPISSSDFFQLLVIRGPLTRFAFASIVGGIEGL